MAEAEVRGAQQLEELGKVLKSADATVLRQELRTDLRWAVKPLTAEMRTSLRTGLPHGGGLAALMAKASIGVRVRTEGRDVGVRIVAEKAGYNLTAVDKGVIHHLVYGRQPWIRQGVHPRLISAPFEANKPSIQLSVLRAMGKTADKITK